MKKHPLKSKTVNSALVIALMAIMSLLGIGETEIAKTYDSLGKENKFDSGKDMVTLLAAAGAVYGRYKVKEKDDEEKD